MQKAMKYRGMVAAVVVASAVAGFSPAAKGEAGGGQKPGAPTYYSVNEDRATFFFSWGVPMGGLLQQAERTNADETRKLTEKKISANKKAIAKIAAEMNKMPDAKTVSDAKRALARFESAVKVYHKVYVSGYGKWPLKEWEAVGEMEYTAKATIAALKDVISKTASAAAKEIYGKRLVELEARHVKLKKRYEMMRDEAMGR